MTHNLQHDILAYDARKPERSPPVRQTPLFLWIRWTASLLLVLMIALPTMAADQVRNLKFVSTAWAPFTNVPGQPRFAIDLVEAALESIGVNAEAVVLDEARLTPSLVGDEFNGSAAVWKDAERERVQIYSEPYLENRLILVGRQGSDVSATSLAALAGKRIALVAGYAYGEAAKATEGPIIVGSTSEENSVAKLRDGEVDYTLMDELVIQYIVNNHAEAAQTRLTYGCMAPSPSLPVGMFLTSGNKQCTDERA